MTFSWPFGNLSLSEIALVLAAVLLLFGARDLALIRDADPKRRAKAQRDYVTALVAGVGFGIAFSAIASPSSVTLPTVVALAGVAIVLFVLERDSDRAAATRMQWNPAVLAMGLLSCALTMDAMQWVTRGA